MNASTNNRAIFILGAIVIAGCVGITPGQQIVPLEVQAIQTKTFNVDKRQIFAASINTLQDLGYQVETVDYPAGFISAVSTLNIRDNNCTANWGRSRRGSLCDSELSITIESINQQRNRVRINLISVTTLALMLKKNLPSTALVV